MFRILKDYKNITLSNNANHNIIIITIKLLLINYNIIVTVITNFGNTMQNMLAMQRNSAKVIVVFLKGNCL